MLRHTGTKRTNKHNFKLASLLGVTAGYVNSAGFLAFAVLTTNVTGHAALFAERIAAQDWHTARVVALWMTLFLAGAFFSSIIVSVIGDNQRFSYTLPIIIEAIILLSVAFWGDRYNGTLVSKELFAGSLLFAMGMQNSLVSIVSGSAVRTTHLTGTFTDLGINLAQYLHKKNQRNDTLKVKIKLHLSLILCFMAGAMMGAYFFRYFKFYSFLVPVVILIVTLIYDVFRLAIKLYHRKLRSR